MEFSNLQRMAAAFRKPVAIGIIAAAMGLLLTAWLVSRPSGPPMAQPAEIPVGSPRVEPKVIFCNNAAVFLAPDGRLWGWGNNSVGLLHPPFNFNYHSLTPIPLGTNANWRDIAADSRGGVGLRTDGTLWRWGPLHAGSSADSPVPVTAETDWQSVSAGIDHVLALKTDGRLWAWGDNFQGQLGDGSPTGQKSPVPVMGQTKWKSVVAGFQNSAGVQADGTLWVWGYVDPWRQSSERQPKQLGTATNWVSVHSATLSFVAQQTDGTVWSWRGAYSEPIQVGPDVSWKLIAAAFGGTQILGIKSDGTLWILTDLAKPNAPPRKIGSRTDWMHLWGGGMCYVAMTADGTLWTAGYVLGEPRRLVPKDRMLVKAAETLSDYGWNVGWGKGGKLRLPTLVKKPWPIMRVIETEPKSETTDESKSTEPRP